MSKRKRRKAMMPAPPAVTFDVLTVCFSARTVLYKGRSITVEADCFFIPLTSDLVPMLRTGWSPIVDR